MKLQEYKRIFKEERAAAVLPAGTINVLNNKTSLDLGDDFIDIKTYSYLVKSDKYKLLISGGGDIGWKVGDNKQLKHDQTGRDLGYIEVVDIIKGKNLSKISKITGKNVISIAVFK